MQKLLKFNNKSIPLTKNKSKTPVKSSNKRYEK